MAAPTIRANQAARETLRLLAWAAGVGVGGTGGLTTSASGCASTSALLADGEAALVESLGRSKSLGMSPPDGTICRLYLAILKSTRLHADAPAIGHAPLRINPKLRPAGSPDSNAPNRTPALAADGACDGVGSPSSEGVASQTAIRGWSWTKSSVDAPVIATTPVRAKRCRRTTMHVACAASGPPAGPWTDPITGSRSEPRRGSRLQVVSAGTLGVFRSVQQL